jgi:hypothetical protein
VKSISYEMDLHLPSLKTLHLNKVDFESYVDLPCLLLGCHILEDLEIISCYMSKFHVRFMNFGIILHNLIKARIPEFHLPLCAISKAKILHLEVV